MIDDFREVAIKKGWVSRRSLLPWQGDEKKVDDSLQTTVYWKGSVIMAFTCTMDRMRGQRSSRQWYGAERRKWKVILGTGTSG